MRKARIAVIGAGGIATNVHLPSLSEIENCEIVAIADMIKSKAQACIQWIQEYYKDNPDGKAIIGISGGKDSTIAAALCVEALGADRVIGVLMPNGEQYDIEDAYGIEYVGANSWYETHTNLMPTSYLEERIKLGENPDKRELRKIMNRYYDRIHFDEMRKYWR